MFRIHSFCTSRNVLFGELLYVNEMLVRNYTTKKLQPSVGGVANLAARNNERGVNRNKFVKVDSEIPTFKSYKNYKMFDEVTIDAETGVSTPTPKKSKVNKDKSEPQKERDGYTGTRLMKFPNGNIYEGQWLKGKMSGKGIMRYARGNVYDGDWNRGRRDGYGVFTLKSGKVYEGEWARDIQEGSVIVRFESGDVLTGTCRDNKLDGHCVIQYANGDHFEGMFKDGAKNGGGVLTLKDGTKTVGKWKNGKYRPLPTTQPSAEPANTQNSIQGDESFSSSSSTKPLDSASAVSLKRGVRLKPFVEPIN